MKIWEQLLFHDSHSILNSVNEPEDAKVEKSTVPKFLKVFFFLVVFFLLIFYFPQKSGEIKTVKIAGQDIKVELALTKEIQEKGLSGRGSLLENTGMLFIFEQPGKYYFWMKDMNFAIDIIWITEDLKVVYIEKNATPKSYPNIFDPKIDAKYVLEVTSGFSEKNNLKEGDTVEFLY